MPISAVCPGCQSAYQLSDQMRGKRVRCKKCQHTFIPGEASATPAEFVQAASHSRPAQPPRPAYEDDEIPAYMDRPIPPESTLVTTLLKAALGLVLVAGICAGGWYWFGQDASAKKGAAVTPTGPISKPALQGPPGGGAPGGPRPGGGPGGGRPGGGRPGGGGPGARQGRPQSREVAASETAPAPAESPASNKAAPKVRGSDWPQWGGPQRNGISLEKGLLKTWPNQGPPLLWTYDNAGIGYSGPAVVDDRLYTQGARGDKEYVFALNTDSGKEVWATEVGPLFVNGWGDGPRGTPTVDSKRLYAIGGQGNLVCVDCADGKLNWKVGLRSDLGGEMMSGWGYTESPLVDGGRVICSPGGSKGTLAALDKGTGQVVWRSKELTDRAAYSSIVVSEAGGIRQYVNLTGSGVAGIAAKDGRLLWHSDLGVNGTAIIPTPIVRGDYVYVTSGYGSGSGLLKLQPAGDGIQAHKVYANKNLQNQHGGVVLVDEHVYGYCDGHGWVCQDFRTGNNVWEERGRLGKGSVICVDGLLYCYTEGDGTLALVEASPKGWQEHGRFKIPKYTQEDRKGGQIWTHPVVANGRLYLRDQDLLFCYDLKAGSH